jgi:hypothetical protein
MDAFFSVGHIALWLLVVGLFFPRLALFFAWLGNGSSYPNSDMPSLLSLVLWAWVTRFLMAYYIFYDQGARNVWFWAYLLSGLWLAYRKSKYSYLKRSLKWKAFYNRARTFRGCKTTPFEDVFEL